MNGKGCKHSPRIPILNHRAMPTKPAADCKEKTPHPMPLSIKNLKTKLRKSVRRQTPKDVPGYDSRREVSDEEGGEEPKEEEEEEEEEEAAVEAENEESDEMPPLGHQGRLEIQNVNDMLYDPHQAINERMDKQDE